MKATLSFNGKDRKQTPVDIFQAAIKFIGSPGVPYPMSKMIKTQFREDGDPSDCIVITLGYNAAIYCDREFVENLVKSLLKINDISVMLRMTEILAGKEGRNGDLNVG